jgi:hypothetical protein
VDLQTRKITFVQEFLRLQNEEIIETLESTLRKKKIDLYELDQKPMTMTEFNDEIDQAMEDSKNGKLINTKDLTAKIRK